jgi:hypothetical protein
VGAQCQPGGLGGSARLGGQLGDMLGRRQSSFQDHRLRRRLGGAGSNVQSADLLPAVKCRAFMLPTTVALVRRPTGPDVAPHSHHGSIAAVADAAGPVTASVLTATLGWPAVFLINLHSLPSLSSLRCVRSSGC